ncbi:unnamed protein product [Thlaspi arvense]|uniref:PWWP domain-containing protein n=1 Tax=Thlaspi arvense TaxID=13288 RepID=A0AAU9SJF0_THLAR|nr:unnamed protein product [Thlaspi arvense]
MKLQNPDKKTLRESNPVASMEEEDDDKARKIEVSGGNISLVVDFSGSLTGTSCENAIEPNGTCRNENLAKEDNQTQELLVGNLVWGMTKSKKWWPGEVAGFKADAKESFMVKYLGESQLVSWCAPSKLKPFKESFESLVNQRNDASFFVAVESAMTLLGNSLKLEMACSCVAEKNGITPPQNGRTRKTKPLILREFSVDRLEPKEFVTQLKNLGRCVFDGGILETTVMKCRLSAFYTFFGHKQLPMDQLQESEVKKSSFNAAKMKDSEFVGSPSIVAATSRRRFRKEWFRKYVSEVDNVSARDDLVNTSPSDLVSKLKLLAVCSEQTENIGLSEWFFSKFRISVFHDENAYKLQLANMAGFKDLNPGTKQKTSKPSRLVNSKIQPFSVVSVADTQQKTIVSKNSSMETLNGISTPDNEQRASKPMKKIKHIIGHSDSSNPVAVERFAKDFQEKLSVQSPQGKASVADSTLIRPAATLVPDLNRRCSAELDHSQRPKTFIPPNAIPQEDQTPRTMMINFQVAAPCSTNHGILGTGFASNQSAYERNFTSADLFTGKKKRGRKRKIPEELPRVEHAINGIPDLNGTTTEPASDVPQAEPTQRRRRRKKEDSPNGLTRGITVLYLKFSSRVSMPSRDDLTSRFSAFGPLDSSETHVSEEFSGAQVAFVSSGDAVEAVKSLEKANPFGEALVSFRLQQKLISVQRNIAPRMPVISQVTPVLRLNSTPTSVDSMRQNLMMMTAMLEKSGDRLSRETKAKLKSEITGLLEKVSSMPSSSSSSTNP